VRSEGLCQWKIPMTACVLTVHNILYKKVIYCLHYSDVVKQETKGMRNEDKTFTATFKLHEDLQQTPT